MNTARIQCSYVGSMAGEEMGSTGRGSIVGVFHHGWYLGRRSSVWLLHNSHYGKVPFGIGIDGFERTIPYRKSLEGSHVYWKDGKLFLPEAELSLQLPKPELPIAIEKLNLKDIKHVRVIAENLLREDGRGELRGLLIKQATLLEGEKTPETTGEQQGSVFLTYSEERIRTFFSALKSWNVENAVKSIKKMIGLGTGLTPSMDDWIVGFLYVSLRVQADSAVCDLFDRVVATVSSAVSSRTNRISAAYLNAAAKGLYFEALENALRATCPRDMEMLLEIGSSSGSDMLTGMAFAIAWFEQFGMTEMIHL